MTSLGKHDVPSPWRAMTGYLGLAILALNVLLWAVLIAMWLLAPGALSTALSIAAVLTVVQLGLLFCPDGLRAVAKQTFFQCLRMRMAAVFVVLLAVALAGTATQMSGDGTLTGEARSFLKWSLLSCGVWLSILTIVVSASLVSNDVQARTIFSVATKPLPRWQYVVGRWLGLSILQAALIVPTSAVIYGVSRYIRMQEQVQNQPVGPADRLKTETEVFTARERVSPSPLDVGREVAERINKLQEDPTKWQSLLQDFMQRKGCDKETAAAQILMDVRKQELSGRQTASPLPAGSGSDIASVLRSAWENPDQKLKWEFHGLRLGGVQATGAGKVVRAPRFGKDTRDNLLAEVIIQTTPQVDAQLFVNGPVKVGEIRGQVAGFVERGVVVLFANDERNRDVLSSWKEGSAIQVTAEPTVQLCYKPVAMGGGEDTVRSLWVIGSPKTAVYPVVRDDANRTMSTITIPAALIDKDGSLLVQFINRSSVSVQVSQDDVAVLYKVDTFEWNFIRTCVLMLLWLMFLGSLGILAGSFVAFPIACLLVLATLPFSLMRGFLEDSVHPAGVAPGQTEIFQSIGQGILAVMGVLLPDWDTISPSGILSGGMNFSWTDLGETAYLQLAVRVLIVLGLACLIFYRRELARVQV